MKWTVCFLSVLALVAAGLGPTQGGQTLFGDVRITSDEGVVVPAEVTLILRRATEGEVGRQNVSSRGRYRFTNLKTGDYEIAVEIGGKEIGRLQQITVGGLSNSPYGFQYDLELRWKPDSSSSRTAGVISAADVYQRTTSNQALFQKAEQAVGKKKYDEAISLLKEVISSDNQDFQVWTALGTIYFMQQKFDESEKAYLQSIAIKPTSARAQLNLGRVRSSEKRYEEAIEPLSHAVELQADSGDANLLLGECYLQVRKGSKAIPYLEAASRLGHPEAHLRLGWLYNAAGMKDKASLEYEEFLKKKPDYQDRERLKQYIKENKSPNN